GFAMVVRQGLSCCRHVEVVDRKSSALMFVFIYLVVAHACGSTMGLGVFMTPDEPT
ncbi:hypothetical protein L195_g025835, partial [Trifolium pratense]